MTMAKLMTLNTQFRKIYEKQDWSDVTVRNVTAFNNYPYHEKIKSLKIKCKFYYPIKDNDLDFFKSLINLNKLDLSGTRFDNNQLQTILLNLPRMSLNTVILDNMPYIDNPSIKTLLSYWNTSNEIKEVSFMHSPGITFDMILKMRHSIEKLSFCYCCGNSKKPQHGYIHISAESKCSEVVIHGNCNSYFTMFENLKKLTFINFKVLERFWSYNILDTLEELNFIDCQLDGYDKYLPYRVCIKGESLKFLLSKVKGGSQSMYVYDIIIFLLEEKNELS
jgi:hypothetical protein